MYQPTRSMLYIPGSRPRALEKAKGLPTDAIIFDLEDAVAITEKAVARDTLAQALEQGGYGTRLQLVRINALNTEWGIDDVAAITPIAPQAVLLPKVDCAADVEALADLLDASPDCADTKIWAMMETPLGVLNALEIAQAPRMGGIVLGTNDLAKDLGARARPDRLPLMAALQACVLAAKAAGIACIDGVYNAFTDTEGLAMECAQGRDLGMDGKTLIHPAQIDVCNDAFCPDAAEIALARRQILAFEAAAAQGLGVAVVDGKIVENLHIVTARKTLAIAEAIAGQKEA